MKKIVLDTNAYSKLLLGTNEVLDSIVDSDIVYMSIFVLGELYAGFKGGTKERKNLKILNQFLKKPTVKVLTGSNETAEIFALIKNQLKNDGKPIPINDVWIAAHTIESGSILVTYDSHFDSIENLRIWMG